MFVNYNEREEWSNQSRLRGMAMTLIFWITFDLFSPLLNLTVIQFSFFFSVSCFFFFFFEMQIPTKIYNVFYPHQREIEGKGKASMNCTLSTGIYLINSWLSLRRDCEGESKRKDNKGKWKGGKGNIFFVGNICRIKFRMFSFISKGKTAFLKIVKKNSGL